MKIVSALFLCCLLLAATLAQADTSRAVISIKAKQQDGKVADIDLYEGSYALVIGVSAYTEGWPPLPGVARDVEEVAASLKKNGFEVVKVTDPTADQLEAAFENFIIKYGSQANSRLLFYFAGHGHTLTPSWGGTPMGYIVPVDAPTPDADPNRFKRLSLNMQRVEEYALNIDAKHALFLFDACFSGSIFALSRAVPEHISYKTDQPVRQFITSGNEEETVPDKSIFRQQFVAGIDGQADTDSDGYVTGAELGSYLQNTVVNYTKGSQHPQYGKIRRAELDKGDFVFLTGGKTRPKPPQTDAATLARLAPPQQPINVNAEEELWLAVKRSSEIEDVQMYLDKYPDGRFADVAHLRISQLRREQKRTDARPRLYVHPEPADATVRLLNIRETYEPGIPLDPGKYQVEVSRKDFETEIRWLQLVADQETNVIIALRPKAPAVVVGPKQEPKPQVQPRLEPKPEPKPEPPPAAVQEPTKVQPEVQLWLAVRGSSDPGDLQRYLDQYPSGSFAPLAHLKIERLDKKAAPSSTAPASPDPATAGAAPLTVTPEPSDARVRILNIRPAYRDGILLVPGRYEVAVSRSGYDTKTQYVEMAGQAKTLTVSLDRRGQQAQTSPSPASVTQSFVRNQNFTEQVTGMEFVWIDGGCFKMGSDDYESGRDEDEGPEHNVCVKGLWVGKYEVTNRQYRLFKPDHDSGSFQGRSLNDDKQPVVGVSWNDAQTYVQWLNGRIGGRFRLPTEAEWEFVTRAGTAQGGQPKSRFWGASPDNACRYANVADTAAKQMGIRKSHDCDDNFAVTAPVGSFLANDFGLHDLLGNAEEWCQDKYGSHYYTLGIMDNPDGPSMGSKRVLRGGSWRDRPSRVRSASRGKLSSDERGDNTGFRLIMRMD